MPIPSFAVRCCVLLCLVFLCAACSLKQGSGQADEAEARTVWERYSARSGAAEKNTGPFRISGSLRWHGPDEQGTRVSSLLWGNGAGDSPYPLRLDLLAGVGNVVAKIREDATSFLAYVPDEKRAYTHAHGMRALIAFGVPVPLTLSDLTLLLTGRAGALFLPGAGREKTPIPEEYAATKNGFAYTIRDAALPGVLELSAVGAPLSWREADTAEGWVFTFEARDDAPLLPRRISITHPKGYFALIVIRETEQLPSPFSLEQLALELPPGTVESHAAGKR